MQKNQDKKFTAAGTNIEAVKRQTKTQVCLIMKSKNS